MVMCSSRSTIPLPSAFCLFAWPYTPLLPLLNLPFLPGLGGMGSRVPQGASFQISDPVTQVETSALVS